MSAATGGRYPTSGLRYRLLPGLAVVCLVTGTYGENSRRRATAPTWSKNRSFLEACDLVKLAPFRGYDYAPAAGAFEKVAREAKTKELAFAARYLRTFSLFLSRRFADAAGAARQLTEDAKGIVEDDRLIGVAEILWERADKGRLRTAESCIARLSSFSRFSPLSKRVPKEQHLPTETVVSLIRFTRRLCAMGETVVYAQAEAKLEALKKGASQTEEQRKIISLLERALAVRQPGKPGHEYAAAGALALFRSECGLRESVLVHWANAASCANVLRQIGSAVHLYLLGHNGVIAPTVRGSEKRNELTLLGMVMPYLGYTREITEHPPHAYRKPGQRWYRLEKNRPFFICPLNRGPRLVYGQYFTRDSSYEYVRHWGRIAPPAGEEVGDLREKGANEKDTSLAVGDDLGKPEGADAGKKATSPSLGLKFVSLDLERDVIVRCKCPHTCPAVATRDREVSFRNVLYANGRASGVPTGR